MLTKLITVIVSQYVHIANHYVVYLTLLICYYISINHTSIKLENIELSIFF